MTPEEEYDFHIEFLKDTFRSWIGNMMRDFDAQGVEIPIEMVANALIDLSDEINEDLHGDIDEFIESLRKDDE